MFKTKASIVLMASAFAMLPGAAAAEPGKGAAVTTTAAHKAGAVSEATLVERYKTLAGGSEDNAKSLVHGLRTKSKIVLTGPSLNPPPPPCTGRICKGGSASTGSGIETIEFMPATDAMGFGNVDVALALTEADLKTKSVTTVKPAHLKAALQGGAAGPLSFEGILARRAAGDGWGEIAKSLGFELK